MLRGMATDPQRPRIALHDPALYINRELSLLEFNRRVLEQAKDPTVPLLERLRFLTICSTNLDEFFEIRVGGLREQEAYGLPGASADAIAPVEAIQRIGVAAHVLVAEQYRVLNEELLPSLDAEGIRILRRAHWNPQQAAWAKRHFINEVLPVLTPMGLDPSHPFPKVLNKGLNFIIALEGKDAFRREAERAVIQVPRALPRVMKLPAKVAGGPHDFVLSRPSSMRTWARSSRG